jgi:hypothetical protein
MAVLAVRSQFCRKPRGSSFGKCLADSKGTIGITAAFFTFGMAARGAIKITVTQQMSALTTRFGKRFHRIGLSCDGTAGIAIPKAIRIPERA